MKIHKPFIPAYKPPYKVIQLKRFEVIDKGIVDGEQWYTVQVEPIVRPWLVEQNPDWWYEHGTQNIKVLDTFDVNEQLLTLIALKWAS